MTKETQTKRVERLETFSGDKERNSPWTESGALNVTATRENSERETVCLIEAVVERKNIDIGSAPSREERRERGSRWNAR